MSKHHTLGKILTMQQTQLTRKTTLRGKPYNPHFSDIETKAEKLSSWLKPQCFTSVRTELQTQVFTLHGLPKKCVFVYISIQARKCRQKKLSGTHGWIRISPVILQIMRFGVKVGPVITHCGLSYALLPVNTRGHCSLEALEPQAALHTQLLRPKPQIHS